MEYYEVQVRFGVTEQLSLQCCELLTELTHVKCDPRQSVNIGYRGSCMPAVKTCVRILEPETVIWIRGMGKTSYFAAKLSQRGWDWKRA